MREQHLLTYRSQEESKFVFFLSLRQFLWWAGGAIVSSKLAALLPPFFGVEVWGEIPYWLPFLVCLAFAHLDHPPTKLTLGEYVFSWIKCRRRKRVFVK